MLARATVTIDLAKIEDNARIVVDALPGIDVVGVTKVTCGSPEVARAMLVGGVHAIGDSRLENIERLRGAGIDTTYWLLRAPTPELADDTVRIADVSLVSEQVIVDALDQAAGRAGCRHKIVAMVDLGDLREGMLAGQMPGFLDHVAQAEHVDVVGVGTSLTCYGAVVPSEENLGELVTLANTVAGQRAAEGESGGHLIVSGGMSSSIELAVAGRMPPGVNNLRIGESIVLGVSTVTREPILGLHTDTVVLRAPVIECVRKPSKPRGETAQDAFGGRPSFEDRGERLRAICAIGRQDVPPEGLRPLDVGVTILGASSDHLILDVDGMAHRPAIGDAISFVPTYAATLRLFTSPYVTKTWS